MPHPVPALLLTFALTLAHSMGACAAGPHPAGPDPAASEIITQFGLREADRPIGQHPRWNPRRVVIVLPPGMSNLMPDFEQKLQAMAGQVELHIDHSETFTPDAEALAGADALMTICNPVTMKQAGADLLWLHNYTVGIDRCLGLPQEQLADRVFSNSKRLMGPAIAEHTIAMMLALARGVPTFTRAQKWDRALSREMRFGEVAGKTMLVVGLGGIGSEVAWRAHGLGMKVTAIRNSSRSGPDYVDYVGLPDELYKLAADADVVVNALPLTDRTTGLFDRAFFDTVRPGALFLSVGRGRSTVTADLISALESGRLYGAGLDVTDPEPLPADSPLWQMNNVIITPHISAQGSDSMRRVAIIAAENLRRYLAGERLLNIVDMTAGY